ncbi:MAG: uroporphyrinogen decarboxylase, partial [Alphaproteobacteria bacterium]|nr:uroporphyrinogen decarboxylase [Alphaproteobacteria bacterium]
RYDYDGAIIFSDLLVIPYALGMSVSFVENEGPRLGPLNLDLLTFENFDENLSNILVGIQKTKNKLPENVTLIGFVGAPWTLSTYMIGGKTKKNFDDVIQFSLKFPQKYETLMEILTDACIRFLCMQIESGVEAVQIFDSWASFVPDCFFDTWVIKPMEKISNHLKRKYPHIPIICFPKGIEAHIDQLVTLTDINALSFGSSAPIKTIIQAQKTHITQGNLDPNILCLGGEILEKQVIRIQNELLVSQRHIFNLGHGILPDTPLENVDKLFALIRS